MMWCSEEVKREQEEQLKQDETVASTYKSDFEKEFEPEEIVITEVREMYRVIFIV